MKAREFWKWVRAAITAVIIVFALLFAVFTWASVDRTGRMTEAKRAGRKVIEAIENYRAVKKELPADLEALDLSAEEKLRWRYDKSSTGYSINCGIGEFLKKGSVLIYSHDDGQYIQGWILTDENGESDW